MTLERAYVRHSNSAGMACFRGTGRQGSRRRRTHRLSALRPSPVVETSRKGIHVRLVNWTMLSGSCLLLTACSGGNPTPTPRVSLPASASPSAAGSPCASVRATTPITKVTTACELLWEPYHVTMVPPLDILQQEHVPSAPKVNNLTNGEVSPADAQHWANADNWGSGWFKWAEANDQPFLLSLLAGPANLSPAEEQALSQGATINQPDCNIYPTSLKLEPVGADGAAYFARKGLPTSDRYVFIATFPGGSCAIEVSYPDGRRTTLPGLSSTVAVFEPGKLHDDQLLGDIWFTDAGGSCNDPAGPPPEWCGR